MKQANRPNESGSKCIRFRDHVDIAPSIDPQNMKISSETPTRFYVHFCILLMIANLKRFIILCIHNRKENMMSVKSRWSFVINFYV